MRKPRLLFLLALLALLPAFPLAAQQLNVGWPVYIEGTVASGATIAMTAGTVLLVTGTSAISTITPTTQCTAPGADCYLLLLADLSTGPFTLTTGGNIAVATSPLAGSLTALVYRPAASKWYPSNVGGGSTPSTQQSYFGPALVAPPTGAGTLPIVVVLPGPILSPELTGLPTAPTPTTGDASTLIPTTQFVATAIANAVAGVNPAVAVLAASTANLTGTYVQVGGGVGDTFNITATGVFTLDGIAINATGQRVLFKDQSTASQNGIYTSTVVGTTGVSAVFTRATDYNTPSDVNNTGAIPIQFGTTNASRSYLLTSQITSIGSSGSSFTYALFSYSPTTLCAPNGSITNLLTDAGSTTGCVSNGNAQLSVGGILTKYDGISTVGLGVPALGWKSQVTAQSANQSVTLATAPGTGVYEIHYSGFKNGTCTGGIVIAFSWTDAGQSETETTGTLLLSPTFANGIVPISVASGNVTFTTTVTGCTYNLDVWMERVI